MANACFTLLFWSSRHSWHPKKDWLRHRVTSVISFPQEINREWRNPINAVATFETAVARLTEPISKDVSRAYGLWAASALQSLRRFNHEGKRYFAPLYASWFLAAVKFAPACHGAYLGFKVCESHTTKESAMNKTARGYRRYIKLSETTMDTRKEDEAEIAAATDALLQALHKHHPNYLQTNRDVEK